MASNNSYSIEGWADRMAAHLQGLSGYVQKIDLATKYPPASSVVSQQIIDFLKRYEKQKSKENHMAEIKSAGNNYNL